MKVLAIDTSARTGSVALCSDDQLDAEFTVAMERMHSERLMLAVEAVLTVTGADPGDVDLVAVSLGPGPFTGLRVGITTAKSLAYGWHVPAVGVSTFDAIAYRHRHVARDICVLLDARRGEVYAAGYQTDAGSRTDALTVAPTPIGAHRCVVVADVIREVVRPTLFVGDGALAYRAAIEEALGDTASIADAESGTCRASAVAWLGLDRDRERGTTAEDAAALAPCYLRRPEAEVTLDRKTT